MGTNKPARGKWIIMGGCMFGILLFIFAASVVFNSVHSPPPTHHVLAQ
jgi:hypothetical protein